MSKMKKILPALAKILLFAFLFVDIFDTLGTVIGCAAKADMLDEEGKLQIAQGDVVVYVGGQAPDERSKKLTGCSVTELSLQIPEAM